MLLERLYSIDDATMEVKVLKAIECSKMMFVYLLLLRQPPHPQTIPLKLFFCGVMINLILKTRQCSGGVFVFASFGLF